MRVLITGITGFVGSHLADWALSQGAEVFGSFRHRSRLENIVHLEGKLTLIEADLRDAASCLRLVERVKPDRVFHLAAQSFVPASWNSPGETITNNVVCQVNLLESIRTLGLNPSILIACSSEEYGEVNVSDIPIKETCPLRPLSPYGVSKVAQDMLGFQYFKSYGTHIVRTRGFNHTGPRRGEVFVTSNFARQVALMEVGLQKPLLMVGNLDAVRDWTDVRDMVRGYWLALEKGEPGEVYNLGSGTKIRIRDLVNLLERYSKVPFKIEVDPARLRPSDVSIIVADCTKVRACTGWKPAIPFETSILDLLNYWRGRLKNKVLP